MTVTLLSVQVKFQTSSTVLVSTVELRMTEQTKSCGCPITPRSNSFGLKNICGVGTKIINIINIDSNVLPYFGELTM